MIFAFCHQDGPFASRLWDVFVLFLLGVSEAESLIELHQSIRLIVLFVGFYDPDTPPANVSKPYVEACKVSTDCQIYPVGDFWQLQIPSIKKNTSKKSKGRV